MTGLADTVPATVSSEISSRSLRILNLARSYPNNVFPELGLWTERPTRRIAETCNVRVISPVPYFPPLPHLERLRQYRRFRDVEHFGVLHGVPVERPRFIVGFGSSLYRFEARAYALGIRRIAERLHREEPFELIHAHFIYPDAVAGAELARRWDIPLVVTEQAPWNGWLERPGVRGPALRAAEVAARLIAVSRSVCDSIVSYTDDPAKVVVVPNGVDPDAYPIGSFDGRDPEQILYVGLINRNKGIDVLLEAMRIIARERPAARLSLVGGSFYRNTRLQREALEQSAEDLVRDGRVRFLGHRPPKDVADLMAQSAVAVLPSRAESFGSVLVEALACGTPVVATRCGGPEDIVDDTVGRLVPTEDPDALAQALLGVLRNRDAYDPETLREHTLRRFSWDHVVAKTLQVYREVTTP